MYDLTNMGDYFSGRIVFDHLTKTAGTAVVTWLRTSLGAGSVSPSDPVVYGLPHLDLVSKFGGLHPIVAGHISFMVGDDLDPRWKYVTILREPLDRCISWLFYFTGNVARDSLNTGYIDGAKAFLDSNGGSCSNEVMEGISNYYVKHFAAINNASPTSGAAALSAALQNIHRYDLVGFQDDLSTFRDELMTLIGFKEEHGIPMENATSRRPSVKEIDPRLHERLIELNDLDIRFFDQVKREINLNLREKTTAKLRRLFSPGQRVSSYEHTQLAKDMTSRFCYSEIASDRRGSLTVLDIPHTLRPAQEFTATVRVINDSAQKWGGNVFFPVNISYRWFSMDGSILLEDGIRTALPSYVCYPGSAITQVIRGAAPATPGIFLLHISLVHERLFWFEDDSTDFRAARIQFVIAET